MDTRCHLLYHSLSFVVTRCTTRCHSLYYSLSLGVLLICLFKRSHRTGTKHKKLAERQKNYYLKESVENADFYEPALNKIMTTHE